MSERKPCQIHAPMPCPEDCPNSPETLTRRLAEEQRDVQNLSARLDHTHRLLADTRAERDALAAQVQRVRALHTQDTSLLAPGKWCPADGDETPCATIRALDDNGGSA